MEVRREELPRAAWLVVGVWLVLAVMALLLIAAGIRHAGLVLFIEVITLPGVILISVIVVGLVRRNGWVRRPQDVIWVLFLCGVLGTMVPLLIWLPFSPPSGTTLGEMPVVLSTLMVGGVVLVFTGSALIWVWETAVAWRRRDYRRAVPPTLALLFAVLLAVLIGFLPIVTH